jgi:hypothetical protein
VRHRCLQVQGGGNCANALTAAARLGLHPSIISKVSKHCAETAAEMSLSRCSQCLSNATAGVLVLPQVGGDSLGDSIIRCAHGRGPGLSVAAAAAVGVAEAARVTCKPTP